jgi:hypothetical protein
MPMPDICIVRAGAGQAADIHPADQDPEPSGAPDRSRFATMRHDNRRTN